jgi:hypothetical protein
MNYLEVAKERNLDLADLPKTLQKKIQEIEALNAEFLKIKIKKEKLKPAELENYNLIEEKIAELDAYLVKKVKIFDPAKYKARLDSFNSMMDKRKAAKKVEEPKEKPKDVEATTESLDYLSKMVPVQQDVQENVQEVVQEPVQQFVQESKPEQDQYEEEYEEDEDDEFAKVGEAKPKKVINKGWWIMGVGFILLTWGAVNVFKEKRG